MRYATILLLSCVLTIAGYGQKKALKIEFRNGTSLQGSVLDNYPPVYAIVSDSHNWEHVIDYQMLDNESAARLATQSPGRFGPRSMPEIPGVSSSTKECNVLDLVHFKDGKIVVGKVEQPRLEKYLILRWPSGEEWICYHEDIDSITHDTLGRAVTFQEFRHYYPSTATVLSVLFPGGGHIYMGDYLTGGIHIFAFATSIFVAQSIINNSHQIGDGIYAVMIVLGARLADVIDAWITASSREKKRAFWQKTRCYTRKSNSSITADFGLSPIPNGGVVGVNIRF